MLTPEALVETEKQCEAKSQEARVDTADGDFVYTCVRIFMHMCVLSPLSVYLSNI